ncbi:MAG: amidase [Planctomycetaceae bacterium]|nr:amidase [Planctomycetaceae bacterium]
MPNLFPEPRETILGLQSEIRTGIATPYSITAETLDRIMRHEMDVRAWVRLYQAEALKLAGEQTVQLSEGNQLGPLAGIPIGIKDIIDIEGSITGCGFEPFLQNDSPNIATATAPLVHRLLEAGAILLGKTTTTQFACFDPTETTNPWNHRHTPGGSSSGSAAAVASGMCYAAIGTQTGGSVTRPAAYCGVIGFKPSYGTLPMEGIFPLAQRHDHAGFFTRSLEDARLLWNICRLTNPIDSQSRNQLRIGNLNHFFGDHAAPQMQEMMQTVLRKLTAADHHVEQTGEDIDFGSILDHHRNIMVYETAQNHRERFEKFAQFYHPAVTSQIQAGLQLPMTDYQASCEVQDQYRAQSDQYFTDFDLLICPATLDEAPSLETTGDPRFNAPWSFLGLPTITFPVQLSKAGLPLGLQLIGPAGCEDQLLEDSILIQTALKNS